MRHPEVKSIGDLKLGNPDIDPRIEAICSNCGSYLFYVLRIDFNSFDDARELARTALKKHQENNPGHRGFIKAGFPHERK